MTGLLMDEATETGQDGGAGAGNLTPADSSRPSAADDSGGEIHFHFPIDIRLVGDTDDEMVDQVVARVFDELQRELERRA